MKRRLNDVVLHFLNRLSNWTFIVGLLFVMQFDNSIEVTNNAKSLSAYPVMAPPPLTKDYISVVNAHLINELKMQIKKVLNMHPDNRTLDKYVTQVFNVKSVNPTYVFVLPDHKNRTLVLRRSDFNEAIFPNVTNLNKFKKSPLNPKGAATNRGAAKEETSDLNDTDNEDYDESQMGRIIEENIRTERNFIEFVDNLNDDLEEEYESSQLSDQYRYSVGQESKISTTKVKAIVDLKRKRIQNSKKIDWKDLGLEGWFGGLSPVGDAFDTALESPKAAGNKTKSHLQPYLPAIKKKPHLPIPRYPSSGEIPDPGDSLVKILNEEKREMSQMGKVQSAKPIWPITSSRDQHHDEDVFIARANNPFGHSTKWKYRNSSSNGITQTRESRSKRGVVQLYSMIKCATGCDPLIYKGYGCYCGFLGSGRALDSIDRCCKMHDYCYSRSNCPMFLEYFVPYLWKCYRGKPLCAVDHGEWGGPGSCAARLCECDRVLSKCLRHHYCPGRRTVCTSSPFRLLQNLVMVF